MSDSLQIPYSQDAERGLIGGLLINPAAYATLDLKASDFYLERHQWIWRAFGRITTKGSIPDFVTICDELERQGKLKEAGGAAYLTSLINQTPSSLHIEHYAGIVKEKARRRRAIFTAQGIVTAAYSDTADMDETIAIAVDDLTSSIRTKHELVPISDVMEETLSYVQERANNPSDTYGVPTGFIDLDRMTGGVNGLWYLGGEPGIGKSILMITAVVNAAKQGYGGAVFSIEMSNLSQGLRVLSAEAQISTRLLRTGQIGDDDWHALYNMAAEIADLPIYICDEPELNTTQLRAHLAKARVKYDIDLFALDYLYLMTDGEGINPTERTEILSKRVKAIQRSMGIAGITVNSVTKAGMDGKSPKQTSMRGSGQLIHDADVVLFITKHSVQENLRVIEITKGRDLAEQGRIDLLKTDSYPTFKDVTYQSPLKGIP